MNNRNKPCPCLSGMKFKKCCGNEAMLAAKRMEQRATDEQAIIEGFAKKAKTQAAEVKGIRAKPSIALVALAATALSIPASPRLKLR